MDSHAGILHHEEGVDLIPSNIELAGLEVMLVNTRAGNGLARIDSALVPFYKQMSKNSEIYKMMSTKPEDFLKSEGLL